MLWAGGIYLLYCAVLFVFQRQMIFPRYLMGEAPAGDHPVPGREQLWLNTGTERVEAWYFPPPADAVTPVPVVIIAHGNAELIDFLPEEFRFLLDFGVGLLLVEYPGYGRSSGAPSQASITRAMAAAHDVIISRPDVDADRIVYLGRSIGGGAVCALAARRPPAGMILISSFTGIRSFAWRYLVPPALVRDPFDNLAVLARYAGPVLVIHGEYDEIIPYRHGRRLAAAAANARLISYDCGHNDCPPDRNRFRQDIGDFLARCGIIGR